MARVNYQHEKRQRDLAKKRKKEEKLQRKTQKGTTEEFEPDPGYNPPLEDAPAPADNATPAGTDKSGENQG